MEYLLESRFTWSRFLVVAICLALLYFLLQFAKQILTNTNYFGELRLPLLKTVNRTLLFYEPIVLLVLISVFVLIRPPLHGLWALLLIIGGFSHIRNYISGRILQMDQGITLGKQISAGQQKGVISEIGRLGLQLKSGEGIHHVSYSQLMSQGFTQSSGEKVGGLHQLTINPTQDNTQPNHLTHLKDLLATTPYLDWNYQPSLSKGLEDAINAKLVVREEGHLRDFVRLLEEWGYRCEIK